MNSNSPIGIFDSGLGGLTVAAEIAKRMPHEKLLFYADSAHNPYGTKTPEEVLGFCREIMEDFRKRDVKAVVIACNTATSVAAAALRSEYDFDIVGMEPALKVAADLRTPARIAVWATALTLQEDKFARLVRRFEKDHEIIPVPCPELVECVETGQLEDNEKVESLLRACLARSGSEMPDAIVLGCTHFVYFRKALEQMIGDRCLIVDGNEGTARRLEDLLAAKNLQSEGEGSVEIINSDPDKIGFSKRMYQKLEEQHVGKENRLGTVQ